MRAPARTVSDDRHTALWQHRLAARVVTLALKDLSNGHGSREHRESAREFLAGSAMLRYWCEVGRLDLRRIERRALTMGAADPPAAAIHAPDWSSQWLASADGSAPLPPRRV